METLLIISIVGPIVLKYITQAQKKYGKGKGKTKKNWAIKGICKEWTNIVATGIVPANLAKLPIPLLLPIIGSLIDSLIGVVNDHQGVVVKKPN